MTLPVLRTAEEIREGLPLPLEDGVIREDALHGLQDGACRAGSGILFEEAPHLASPRCGRERAEGREEG